MLTYLHVKNFAVVEDVSLNLYDHLNILTGETGAGKSIIIGAVSIALGGRVSSDMIRSGEDFAYVEMICEPEEGLLPALKSMDIYPEEGSLVISRKIMPGKSVSKINGETVTAGTIKAVSALLIDMYGQHEHQSLTNSAKHLEIIDRYAKTENLKNEVADIYARYDVVKKEWDRLQVSDKDRQRELSFIEYEMREIEAAAIKADEEEELDILYRRLANSEKICEALSEAYGYTGASDASASMYISKALSVLSTVVSYDEKLAEYEKVLIDADSILADFNRDIASFMDDYTFDEELYKETYDRLEFIRKMFAKYGGSYEKLEEHYEKISERHKELISIEERRSAVNKELTAVEKELLDAYDRLTFERISKSEYLIKDITEALSDLNFNDVKFDISFTKKEAYDAEGMDKAEFMISVNPGEDIKPLALVSSGGELSRIMLGIKSVLADNDSIHTLVFDEIDAGISGRTAQKVSEKLAELAREHQVICITHLAQIASMADVHYVIEKNVINNRTRTDIRRLSEEESILELGRILGGTQITEAVISSATEMRKLACAWKEKM